MKHLTNAQEKVAQYNRKNSNSGEKKRTRAKQTIRGQKVLKKPKSQKIL